MSRRASLVELPEPMPRRQTPPLPLNGPVLQQLYDYPPISAAPDVVEDAQRAEPDAVHSAPAGISEADRRAESDAVHPPSLSVPSPLHPPSPVAGRGQGDTSVPRSPSQDILNVLPVLLSNRISVDARDGIQYLSTYTLNRDFQFISVLTPAVLATLHPADIGTRHIFCTTSDIANFV
ncbi:hypothetical protein C8J57DRAFT_1708564, partial [Mycena rebaudengoi]